MVKKVEGAQKQLEENDKLPIIRGGKRIKWFVDYPASGSSLSKL